ncbi:transmembrane protein 11, mitochondrial isoform X2 [Monodelphis domestica]|uniref:transmembrane protein 11, mitochondrial isoform X2 n=1 Tax=Monodelphis domestica TaxID=13616 RepID=UPI0024E22637|nr:transmembrane protein 11, mitochondrial isoform X2 [Monodelphis domestica]
MPPGGMALCTVGMVVSPGFRLPHPGLSQCRGPDYISLQSSRFPSTASAETFANGVSPRWLLGEGGALARAAVAAVPERGEPPGAAALPGPVAEGVGSQREASGAGVAAVPASSPVLRVTLSASECYIVHEIYNGENAQDQFEYELEQALEAQYKYIVIEPTRIGDETARWITVGNCLHKTAVLAGSACLFTPLALPLDYSHYISLPAGVLSMACCTLYGISWQFDPCCKYQVEYDAYKLSRLPLHTLTSSTPVVLVRKDDLHRKRLHNTIALAAMVYCVKKIYELYAV